MYIVMLDNGIRAFFCKKLCLFLVVIVKLNYRNYLLSDDFKKLLEFGYLGAKMRT